MTYERPIVTAGQVVFDKEEAANTPWMVVTPDAGAVADQDPFVQELIRDAPMNEDYDTSDTAECVEMVIMAPDVGDMVYTFPKERVLVPGSSELLANERPAVWSKAVMLADLCEELGVTEAVAMDAGIDGSILLTAQEILATRGVAKTFEDGDDVFVEEQTTCPECETGLSYADGIESSGVGTASGVVVCPNCKWDGQEEWVHKRTVRIRDHDD